MSRTKRYVPHWVREGHLHPWIDPETGEPHVWGTVHRQLRWKQREAARLRGDDGRCPNHNRWNNRWRNPMDAVRTDYRRLIAEGIGDHFDALEDHGKTFNWLGESEDQQDLNEWYDSIQEEYEQMLEDEERERQYEREMSDYWYDEPCWDTFSYHTFI